MKPSKRVIPVRRYAGGAVISALFVLSPAVTFLVLIAAEMLTDLLLVGGTVADCAVAAAALGLVLSRKFWRRASDSGAVKEGFGKIAHV